MKKFSFRLLFLINSIFFLSSCSFQTKIETFFLFDQKFILVNQYYGDESNQAAELKNRDSFVYFFANKSAHLKLLTVSDITYEFDAQYWIKVSKPGNNGVGEIAYDDYTYSVSFVNSYYIIFNFKEFVNSDGDMLSMKFQRWG